MKRSKIALAVVTLAACVFGTGCATTIRTGVYYDPAPPVIVVEPAPIVVYPRYYPAPVYRYHYHGPRYYPRHHHHQHR